MLVLARLAPFLPRFDFFDEEGDEDDEEEDRLLPTARDEEDDDDDVEVDADVDADAVAACFNHTFLPVIFTRRFRHSSTYCFHSWASLSST